ncbi:MAG: hypothetical protein HY279_04460 [Nitrospinae bacterium]|nr:hypothetical protein [Nitrospinota bacterium]
MIREEAAKIYIDGVLSKNVDIGKFFEAARSLSKEDKDRIQLSVERYATNPKSTGERKGGDKEKCLVL